MSTQGLDLSIREMTAGNPSPRSRRAYCEGTCRFGSVKSDVLEQDTVMMDKLGRKKEVQDMDSSNEAMTAM